ncbi:putative carbon monoxide dehydrogenase medium subunit [Actinoplanes missouriensis 431]|uniref:Putative carbon monoxide dehydrogenase medium subunit n=1 Tax=Actinoplanes missouriensis (strain ATCC 14538 / DSM 43046 / CBS 188.64 / JCM 3121 / NBRC 102363 / NCIMB 12654 / NRRL B-3342 / UNCC 431) TaxID=512565 RepID=I0HD27_ACTM4|nr:FAD binding domain-containing protein [Actinoplanes missouriensis]BAL90914.1 putative carbon monoxide dehydrogenase medium subunit [Actinoplanes missouriensis 431]
MTAFEYIGATGMDEVLDALADGAGSVLAGGQSLTLQAGDTETAVRRVVDINRVSGLDTLAANDGSLRVGPLVRHRTFESAGVTGPLGDLLRAVVCHIGHPPIRARGTMLGSFAFAHPAAEWPVVAMMLDARMTLTGRNGSRTVAAESFFTGPFTTARRPDEMLTEAQLRVLPAGTGIGYAEDRRTTIFPQAAAIAAITVTEGVVSAASIGLVNAGPCPVRARAAEKALLDGPLSDAAISAAAEAAADVDATGGGTAADRLMRQRAFRTLARRALSQARDGLGVRAHP